MNAATILSRVVSGAAELAGAEFRAGFDADLRAGLRAMGELLTTDGASNGCYE